MGTKTNVYYNCVLGFTVYGTYYIINNSICILRSRQQKILELMRYFVLHDWKGIFVEQITRRLLHGQIHILFLPLDLIVFPLLENKNWYWASTAAAQSFYSAFILLSLCSYSAITLLLLCSCSALLVFSSWSYPARTLLLFCCFSAFILLFLCSCYAPTLLYLCSHPVLILLLLCFPAAFHLLLFCL